MVMTTDEMWGPNLPSGRFWTTAVSASEAGFSDDGSYAELDVHRRLPIIDTFQFFGPNSQPAEVRVRVTWEALGPPVPRGKGKTVPGDNLASFLGQIAPARSVGHFSGKQMGFAFSSDDASTDRGYARIGAERNGSFLLPNNGGVRPAADLQHLAARV